MNIKNLLLLICLFVPAAANAAEQQTAQQITPLLFQEEAHAAIINQLTETEKIFFSDHEHQWLFLKKMFIDETNNNLKSCLALFLEAIISIVIFGCTARWALNFNELRLTVLGIPVVIFALKFFNEHAIVETGGLNSLHDILAIHQNPDDFKKYIPEELWNTFDKLSEELSASMYSHKYAYNTYLTHQVETLVQTIYDLIKTKIPSTKLPSNIVKEKLIIYTLINMAIAIYLLRTDN